jgi:U32 family peptidase
LSIELIAYTRNVEETSLLIHDVNIDSVICGHSMFSLRTLGDVDLDELIEIRKLTNQYNKKLYVSVNAIFHEDMLDELTSYINKLDALQVDAIIFGDPGVMSIVKEQHIKTKLFYHPETLATNYETLRFWQDIGVDRVVLSNELSLDEIIEIQNNLAIPVEVQVQGMTCIFQSKRPLVSNYYQYTSMNKEEKNAYFIRQAKEDDTHYPIFEDVNGTHIMSTNDICMLKHLPQLFDNGICKIRVNGFLKSMDYNVEMAKCYREAINVYMEDSDIYASQVTQLMEKIEAMQPKQRKLDTGFYYKKQIY